jgi:hypothetical protein
VTGDEKVDKSPENDKNKLQTVASQKNKKQQEPERKPEEDTPFKDIFTKWKEQRVRLEIEIQRKLDPSTASPFTGHYINPLTSSPSFSPSSSRGSLSNSQLMAPLQSFSKPKEKHDDSNNGNHINGTGNHNSGESNVNNSNDNEGDGGNGDDVYNGEMNNVNESYKINGKENHVLEFATLDQSLTASIHANGVIQHAAMVITLSYISPEHSTLFFSFTYFPFLFSIILFDC